MIYDEYSLAPGEGCDLDSIPPAKDYLIDLMLRKYRIAPNLPDALQQLGRKLRKELRSEQPGRPPDDMKIAIAMSLAGVTTADDAADIAVKIASRFSYLSRKSLTQKIQRWIRKYGSPVGG